MNRVISGIFCAVTKHDEWMGGDHVETQMQARNGSGRHHTTRSNRILRDAFRYDFIAVPRRPANPVGKKARISITLDPDLHKWLVSHTGPGKRFGSLSQGIETALASARKAGR